MANKLYIKDEMNLEGISMQEGKSSSTFKLIGFIIVSIIVIGIIILTIGKYFASSEKQKDNGKAIVVLPTSSKQINPTGIPEISPTISVSVKTTATPSVTLKPSIKISTTPTVGPTAKAIALTIDVLNGSGIKGVAKSMSNVLSEAGYTIGTTGNADAYTYKGITINIKKSKASFLDSLKKVLTKNNYIVSSSTTTLAESETADAVVIVGE